MENNCIFCQIVKNQKFSHKIYEDQRFLAFLDVYPRTEGHTLVIPKIHYRWVYDVPFFDQYWLTVLKITNAMKKAFNPYFISYTTHGLQIPHAHIHILPRKKRETDFIPEVKNISYKQLSLIANKLKKFL